jgi:sigma-B regulation protein RsbU (phosphoserine phosphatase)
MLLGAVENTPYREGRIHLESGDLLLLFTDGLTEAEDPNGEPFGENRLTDAALAVLDLGCSDIVQHIHRTIFNFSGARLADDFTVVALKVR